MAVINRPRFRVLKLLRKHSRARRPVSQPSAPSLMSINNSRVNAKRKLRLKMRREASRSSLTHQDDTRSEGILPVRGSLATLRKPHTHGHTIQDPPAAQTATAHTPATNAVVSCGCLCANNTTGRWDRVEASKGQRQKGADDDNSSVYPTV